MNFYSTKNKNRAYSLREAVMLGLPEDNGLFMPESIPRLQNSFFENIQNKNFQEISLEISSLFFDHIPPSSLHDIVYDAINFDVPLIHLHDQTHIAELFHGPTLAFKDFGARFLARMMGYLLIEEKTKITILVATSGDTGSAVANGFFDVEGIDVIILYPSGRVSPLQEKQITTLGKNITALEISGNFDDCQALVKNAFLDKTLQKKKNLSSANSINIGRLIPQTFYYFRAWQKLNSNVPVVFSVPSGNFGNLTSGIFAKQMGLPIQKLIASTNANKVIPDFLYSGKFEPNNSIATISNAMDVGNPSNFQRMNSIFDSLEKLKNEISGYHFSDEETKRIMQEVHQQFDYISDPHTAVGLLGSNKYKKENNSEGASIVLGTAHPSKFLETVEQVLGVKIQLPEQLEKVKLLQKNSIQMENNFDKLKQFLLDKN